MSLDYSNNFTAKTAKSAKNRAKVGALLAVLVVKFFRIIQACGRGSDGVEIFDFQTFDLNYGRLRYF